MSTYLILVLSIFAISTCLARDSSHYLQKLQTGTVKQTLKLFAGFGCTKESLDVKGSIPDLRSLKFSTTKSFQLVGVWIFYSNTDYNKNGWDNKRSESYFDSSIKCRNLKTTAGNVASVRSAGILTNYTQSSITFFELDYFEGDQQVLKGRQSNLKYEFKEQSSAIITGQNHWTVFDLPNFQGKATCLNSTSLSGRNPTFVSKVGTRVRSVAVGCAAKKSF